ncbi:dihydropyrimidinase [Pseudohalocynthiibacter sp. F2068]|jgi:dihydropyrimidinase|uniref:dihydropyrimidinase n=1 Tax=Pseudohalocynthiibacter sp. F2068 TaxID=2926418 RepID=UPI001FF15079|nr:dihydropyrimidinase [Pseudohalocynthiibacter sp. F2068]MCK0100707.1 dihydropyrimidinase [Pseudohalocynthiibacter sp. F2068]
MSHNLAIRGGLLATATETFRADIGIRDGRIVTIAEAVTDAEDVIDATDRIVMPGGIEAHCHIAQESGMGVMTSDDYQSGSISAAFGGNSCFVPFAAQKTGQSLAETMQTYDGRAVPKSVLDWSYHLILTDPTPDVLAELPEVFAKGVTSFKVFMTYATRVSDAQFLDILSVAGRHGALTMVHAENHDMLDWMARRMVEGGNVAPRYHAPSRPGLAEEEAINRAISLARLAQAPLFIVHVSTQVGAELVANARAKGGQVWAETCPQYLFLTREDLDKPDMEGAKFICSPPLRDTSTQAALWQHVQAGSLSLVSSDHAPYRYDETGKFNAGHDISFRQIANGMPGIEMRLPLLFSEGVTKGRISLNQFVALSSTNAAQIYGMLPRKGSLSIGADADIAIWDPNETWFADEMHDAMDYNPFAGIKVTGRPVTVLGRGRRIVDKGELIAEPGSGQFVKRAPVDSTGHPGQPVPELDPTQNFGAILP